MHCLVQFSTLKSRPPLLEPPESVHVSLHLSPFSSHVRIKPHNNGENNRLPAALPRSLFLLLLPLALPFSPRLCSLDSNRAHYYNRQWPLSLSLSLSLSLLILSLHDIVIYLSLMLLIVGLAHSGGGRRTGEESLIADGVMRPIIKFPGRGSS